MDQSTNIVRLPSAIKRGNSAQSPCAACPIRDLAVCSTLDDDELDRLNAIRLPVQLPHGAAAFDEGAPADYVYNLTAGTMKLYKLLPDGRRQITGFVFPGDFLGLTFNKEYVHTAEAITDATLCKFKRSQLERLFHELPKLESRLLDISRHELAEAHNQMLLLGRKSAKERIASFLIMLTARAERLELPCAPLEIPMSRNDIGDYLGLTTETVSRTLTRLKQSGVIALNSDRRISIIDAETLNEIAEGF
ncbi:MAG: helix-turn-helix domain-containing protein [Rhodobacteraceae bacterium]|jgi:CRP/FNR family transcriptional regulator, anaerobic regulatory protein|nr:helix-turn-helix domain-containing protein [Paracoccaceae bacterium]